MKQMTKANVDFFIFTFDIKPMNYHLFCRKRLHFKSIINFYIHTFQIPMLYKFVIPFKNIESCTKKSQLSVYFF